MDIIHEEYLTKNLFVASFLLASRKVKFLGLETLDYKTKLFRFSPKQKAEELETAYFQGQALPVKTVFSEYNSLKDILFSREPNGEVEDGDN
jgi:hypothetical protein